MKPEKTLLPVGRPRDAGEPRTVVVRCRMTHEERDKAMLAAELEGVVLSEKLRRFINRWATDRIEGVKKRRMANPRNMPKAPG